MSLPVFCSPKKYIFFSNSFENRERRERFRLGNFATVCTRWDLNINSGCFWKLYNAATAGRDPMIVSHPVYRDTVIRLFWKAAQINLSLLMSSHYYTPAILWELRWRSRVWKLSTATQFVYTFVNFSLNFKRELNIIVMCLVITKTLLLSL